MQEPWNPDASFSPAQRPVVSTVPAPTASSSEGCILSPEAPGLCWLCLLSVDGGTAGNQGPRFFSRKVSVTASTHDPQHLRYTVNSMEVGLTMTVAIRDFVVRLCPQFPHLGNGDVSHKHFTK